MGPLQNAQLPSPDKIITINDIPDDIVIMKISPFLNDVDQNALAVSNRHFFNLKESDKFFLAKKNISIAKKDLSIIEGLVKVILKKSDIPLSMQLRIDSYKKKIEFLEKNQKESNEFRKEMDQISIRVNLLKDQLLNQIARIPELSLLEFSVKEFSSEQLDKIFSNKLTVLREFSGLVLTYTKIEQVVKIPFLMISDGSFDKEFNLLIEENMLIKARELLERISKNYFFKFSLTFKLFKRILEKEGLISAIKFFESLDTLQLKERDCFYFQKQCSLLIIEKGWIKPAIKMIERLDRSIDPEEFIKALLKTDLEVKEIIRLACLFNDPGRSRALQKIFKTLKNPSIEDLESIAKEISEEKSLQVLEKCVIQCLEESDLSKAQKFIDQISSLKASVPLASSYLLIISRKLLEKGLIQFVLPILDKMEFNSYLSTKPGLFKEVLVFFVKNKEIEKAEDLVEKIFKEDKLPFKEIDTVFFEFFKALFQEEQYSLERLEKMIVDKIPPEFKKDINDLICKALVEVDKNELRAKAFIEKREIELRENLFRSVASALIPIDRNKAKEIVEELSKSDPKFRPDTFYNAVIQFLVSPEQLKVERNMKEVIELLDKISIDFQFLKNDFLKFYINHFMNLVDPEIAAQLINDGPDFPGKEGVCIASFKKMKGYNLKLAQEFIETIRDEQLREKMQS